MSMKKETLIYLAPFLDIFQIIGLILSLLVGGVDCAHTFFWWLFLLQIKVLEAPNFLTFLYTYGDPSYTLVLKSHGIVNNKFNHIYESGDK